MNTVKNTSSEGNADIRMASTIPGVEAPPEANAPIFPEPEVSAKPARRRFTAEYKLRILKQADACIESGSLGALLRREGLYASSISTWRRQREHGVISALASKKRGRKEPVRDHPLLAENEKLRKENEQLSSRLRQAEIIIDVQKKISQILGIPPTPPAKGGKE